MGIGMVLLFSSCSDVLEVDNYNVLNDDEHYQDINDANNAILGVYALFQDLAPQLVVLNELRADLMDVTNNANHYLQGVSQHNTIVDNPWTNARPFYKVINNCNDVMANLTIMYNNSRITRDQYYQRYSDMGALRSYVYLQLVIHYGKVPYITTPIETIDDLSVINTSAAPTLGLEEMLATLLTFMEELPYKDEYTDTELTNGFDGFTLRISFIDKAYLLGELHLWNGNYLAAATYFKYIMERNAGNMDRYKLPTDFFNFTHYYSRYERYYENDIESVVNNWGTLFSTYGTGDYYDEWIWVMYYHSVYEQSPFYQLFSKENGNYYLKPSKKVMDLWESQIQGNGFVGDFRGNIEDENGNTGSFRLVGGDPVITKYISDYQAEKPYELGGKWFLWRATSLHLRYSEAANRDGKHKVAYALMNRGIASAYAYPGDKSTIVGPFNWEMTHLPEPYNFDARSTNNVQVPPVYRGLWNRNSGIRSRVSLASFTVPADQDSLMYIEDKILEENALELAFEGNRWGDLVRMSLRRGDNTLLANKIAEKFEKAGDTGNAERVRTLLSDRENWWLPLNIENE